MRALEQADVYLNWTLDEGTDHPRRGHAYVFAEAEVVRWINLEHGPASTPRMLEIVQRWRAAHPPTPTQKLLRRMRWAEPEGRWCFVGDLGAVSKLLAERALIHELAPGGDALTLPEHFLRRPIGRMVAAALGPVPWPATLEAPAVCVGPRGIVSAREGDELVVCAARPGSIHAGGGQTRTAAVWCSHDAGASWEELDWTLGVDQRSTDAGRHCWPPEQILRAQIVDGAPVIEWDDPWIDWEPGEQRRAAWVPAQRVWRMQVRRG